MSHIIFNLFKRAKSHFQRLEVALRRRGRWGPCLRTWPWPTPTPTSRAPGPPCPVGLSPTHSVVNPSLGLPGKTVSTNRPVGIYTIRKDMSMRVSYTFQTFILNLTYQQLEAPQALLFQGVLALSLQGPLPPASSQKASFPAGSPRRRRVHGGSLQLGCRSGQAASPTGVGRGHSCRLRGRQVT